MAVARQPQQQAPDASCARGRERRDEDGAQTRRGPAAVLEQHHLSMTRKPSLLEPTSSEKLVYVAPPATSAGPSFEALLAQVNPGQILPGY